MKKIKVLAFARLSGLMALNWAAVADDATGNAADQILALERCKAVSDDDARLACLDKTLNGFDFERAAKALRVATGHAVESDETKAKKAKAEKARQKKEFGKIRITKEGPKLIEDEIKSVRKLRTGKYLFTLASGQVWHQTDTDNPGRVKEGMKVKIKKGGLGNYLMTIKLSRRTLRVKRVK